MTRGVDIGSLSGALHFDAGTGIWRPNVSDAAELAYPADQNDACFRLEDGSFWFNHRNQCITTAVQRFPPDGFILDVGGGNGYVAQGLIQAGYETVVLEPGGDGARNAKTGRNVPTVINATMEEAALRTGSVPSAGLFDVLEHIDDDRRLVRQLGEIMRPGGFLYLTVPAFSWLWSISDVDARHYRRYTIRSIADALAGSFDVLYSTYIFQRLVPIFALVRAVPYRIGFAKPRPAETYEREHAAGSRRLADLFGRMLRHEIEAIRTGKSMIVGTSLLVVARRVVNE